MQGWLPVVVFYHGGGWTVDTVETHDKAVHVMCAASGCVFASVDYRLAPEHKFPAGIEDAYTGLQWVYDNAEQIGVVETGRGVRRQFRRQFCGGHVSAGPGPKRCPHPKAGPHLSQYGFRHGGMGVRPDSRQWVLLHEGRSAVVLEPLCGRFL